MKPKTFLTLKLLRQHESVTTHDLLIAGCGSRYSSRIWELRHEFGCVIDEHRLTGDVSGSRYRLISEPDGLTLQSRPPDSEPTDASPARIAADLDAAHARLCAASDTLGPVADGAGGDLRTAPPSAASETKRRDQDPTRAQLSLLEAA